MFIRYNSTAKYWEYDTSGGSGAGPWLILPIDASQITQGIIPDSVLSSNVALLNATSNTFSGRQVFSGAGQRFDVAGGVYFQQYLTVDGKIVVWGGLESYSGVKERQRVVAMGEWENYTPIWKSGSGGSGIGNGTIQGRFSLVGKTCFVKIGIITGSTTTYPTSIWGFSVPSGYPINGSYFYTNVSLGSILIYSGATGKMYSGTVFHGAFMTAALDNCLGATVNLGTKAPYDYSPFIQQNIPEVWSTTSYILMNACYDFA